MTQPWLLLILFLCLDYSNMYSLPSHCPFRSFLSCFLDSLFSGGEPCQQTVSFGFFWAGLQTVFPAFSVSCDQRLIPSLSNPHDLSLVPRWGKTSFWRESLTESSFLSFKFACITVLYYKCMGVLTYLSL